MLRILITLFTLALGTLQASERCNVIHVKEAMQLNRERREQYRQDGHKAAAKVINKLIMLEKLMLPFSRSLDNRVVELQEAGVAMWCEDLVAMDTVPEYQASTSAPIDSFKSLDKKIKKDLIRSMKSFSFKQRFKLYEKISDIILFQLHDHHFNCLTRHFLEASARSLLMSDTHLAKTPEHLEKKLKVALEKLISQMATALYFAAYIDKKAAPLQAQGIPVICQEMPPIPWNL